MFGWLRRRYRREQRMLAYQNSCATEATLAGYFSTDPAMLEKLEMLAAENRQLAIKLADSVPLTPDKATRLIEINKIARRIYGTTASRFVERFDRAHTPMRGWDWHLSRDD